jgi:hypothetical protein
VLLVAGAVLGPLLAVLPSKRQRYLAELRDQAGAYGVQVRVRQLPEVPPRMRYVPAPDLMCYERVLEGRRAPPWRSSLFVRNEAGDWQSPDPERSPPALLDALPGGATLAVLGGQTLQIYWDEQGGEPALASIATAMDGLMGDAPTADDKLRPSA